MEAHHLPNKANINASVKQWHYFSHCLKSSQKLLSRSRESFTPSKLPLQGLPRTQFSLPLQFKTNSTKWKKWDILVQFRKWWIRLKAKAHLKMKNAFVLSDLLSCYLSILFVCELLSFCNIIYGNVSHLSNTMASKTTKMSPFRSCDLVSQKKNTNLVVSSFGSHY